MKLNYVGIVGGILAFVTLALPWWMVSAGAGISWNVYTWGQTASGFPSGFPIPSNPYSLSTWAGYAAMALVIIGGILAIVGSIMAAKAKLMLLGSGVLDFLSLVVFIFEFNGALPGASACSGYSLIFCSQSGVSAYLSYGYWLALVAGIISLVAIKTMGMGAPKAAAAPSSPSM